MTATHDSDATAVLDPAAAADAAGLVYVSDEDPGIRRRRCGRGWSYTLPGGALLRDDDERRRIAALAVPPAWREVWICPDPRGHLQATGRDDRDRKQYRYHDRWREVRDQAKFHKLIAFGESLPRLRQRLEADLGRRGVARERVLATVVRLLENTLVRVGNDEYARDNRSYGLTTLERRHVEVDGWTLRLSFRAKGGKRREVAARDRRAAAVVQRCAELRGQDLFCYVDEDGTVRDVGSGDVNDYLREVAGDDFTAKDFRTWGGTLHAALGLHAAGEPEDAAAAGKAVRATVAEVADRLGNTAAVCRRCYVHPDVIAAYEAGRLHRHFARRRAKGGLDRDEAALLALLRDERPS